MVDRLNGIHRLIVPSPLRLLFIPEVCGVFHRRVGRVRAKVFDFDKPDFLGQSVRPDVEIHAMPPEVANPTGRTLADGGRHRDRPSPCRRNCGSVFTPISILSSTTQSARHQLTIVLAVRAYAPKQVPDKAPQSVKLNQ